MSASVSTIGGSTGAGTVSVTAARGAQPAIDTATTKKAARSTPH
jgi:hypothetical protein